MDAYETLHKIGGGTFGTVYLCRKRAKDVPQGSDCGDQQKFVAVKKMKRQYFNWDECMNLREVRALKRLYHRNIIQLHEIIREDDHLYLVFEHMDENLYQLIRNQILPFPERTIKNIVSQVLEGLAYMHGNNFFHRDIKPENLLCRDGGNQIKIADFGLTRETTSEPPYTDYVSTRWYRAPELLMHSSRYDWSVDIWAVGCITCELYTLKPIFPGRSEIDQIMKICQVLGQPDLLAWPEGQRMAALVQVNFSSFVPVELAELVTDCSEGGLRVIGKMLRWIPSSRPQAKSILDDEYFRA